MLCFRGGGASGAGAKHASGGRGGLLRESAGFSRNTQVPAKHRASGWRRWRSPGLGSRPRKVDAAIKALPASQTQDVPMQEQSELDFS